MELPTLTCDMALSWCAVGSRAWMASSPGSIDLAIVHDRTTIVSDITRVDRRGWLGGGGSCASIKEQGC